MKCFSLLLTIFFCLSSFGQVLDGGNVIVELLPVDKKEIANGDRIEVELQTSTDVEGINFNKFINTKVAGQFYILDYYKLDAKHLFYGFVTNPSQGKENNIKKDINFVMSKEFEFTFKKERLTKDFILIDKDYKLPVEKNYQVPVLAALTVIILVLVVFKFLYLPNRNKRLLLEKKRHKAKQLILSLENVKRREDFEKIYKLRKQIENLTEVSKADLNRFTKELDKIQYKKDWSPEEQLLVEKIFKKIASADIKDGI